MKNLILQLDKLDRPREKLIRYGPARLSNSELLAVMLGTGTQGCDALKLARELLAIYPLHDLVRNSAVGLLREKGIGYAKAATILAGIELGKRVTTKQSKPMLVHPKDVWDALQDIRSQRKEHLVVFYLNAQQQEIHREIVSIGTLTALLIHPREVFEPAIQQNAYAILLAHNHPSGHCEPSPEDRALTERLDEAGILLGIPLVDHVIVSFEGYWSFREQGLLGGGDLEVLGERPS